MDKMQMAAKQANIVLLIMTGITVTPITVTPHSELHESLLNRETLTGGFAGLNDYTAQTGIKIGLNATSIYMSNMRGGLRTSDHSGRYTGSYDMEVNGNLEKLFGMQGASFYILAEGSWPAAEGSDPESVGSFLGVNDDAGGCQSINITEFWYEQALTDSTVLIRFGKLDLTAGFECRKCPASFDGNGFADNGTSKYLNSALVNNPTIPFPDNGLAAMVFYNPVDYWYASAAIADAQADNRETGIKTAFHDKDDFFYVIETGVTPQFNSLQGAYRFGVWYDPQEKQRFTDQASKRDDVGFYLSCDQHLHRENPDVDEDRQGLGVFLRYGWTDCEVEPEIINFWSLGLQYHGLIPRRDDDIVAVGVAQGIFSDKAELENDNETIIELYYNTQVTPWLNISPSIQYIAGPAGDPDASDALIIAVRMQMAF